jgi:AcrR family transcriptional regulator
MDKKEVIINTARDLFTKYGYKKVSMDEIANEANVTKKTIYSYFTDKDTLFMYFINEEIENVKNEFEIIEKKNIPFVEKVSTSIYNMLLFRKNSILISNVSKEAKNNIQQSINFLKVYNDSILNYIEEKINNEIKLGNIKKCDAHLTAFIIYKMYVSLLFEYDKDINEKQVTKEVTSILKDGLFN